MQVINFDQNKPPTVKKAQVRTARQPVPKAPSGLPPKQKSRKVFFSILAIILLVVVAVAWKVNAVGSKIFGSHVSFFQQASNLVSGNQAAAKLQGEDNGQINILLLGYGGTGHDGPYLTDSMILASIRPDDKKVLLTSIPRDTYYQSAQGEKINAVFPSGFNTNSQTITAQNIESGGAAAEAAVGSISGLTIPYFASIDFQGFIDAVNKVGALEINVENAFTDDQYPNGDANADGPNCTAAQGDIASTCRYITVHFDAGPQTMDGATALEYARSRHSESIEGSDFARSKRQQLVLEAFKAKVENLNLFTNASAINDLINILADHLHTNMTLAQGNHLAQILREPGMQILSQSLDPSTNLVCNGVLPTDGADVVEPCPGIAPSSIESFFQNGFQYAPFRFEQASVIMENDSSTTTQYNKIKQELTDAGANVYEVDYHGAALSQNVLYTVNNNKPATQAYLVQQLGVASQPLPPTKTAQADLVVIIADGSKVANTAAQ